MVFLIDEDLPRSIGNLCSQYGHKVFDVRDIGLRGVRDFQIASYAKKNKICLVTGDFDFSDIRNYPPSEYSGIIVLSIPKDVSSAFILGLFENFLKEEKIVSEASGRLIIVEPGRIRIRKK